MLPEVRQYHKYRHGLVIVDGVVCYKDRVVIPDTGSGDTTLCTPGGEQYGEQGRTDCFLARDNDRHKQNEGNV